MDRSAKIYVAGHTGLVGSALCRRLRAADYTTILTATREQLDLTHADAVQDFFDYHEPKFVFLCAAKVGGIVGNAEAPADYLMDNLAIEMNVIRNAHQFHAKKLLFLGSACAYPKLAPVPIREESLLTGALEPTNASYAIAKIAGIRMCQAYRMQHGDDFIAAMPTNLYGIGDHYDLTTSHVIPGMMRRIHEAKKSGAESVTLWGTGTPRREFLYADDLADACIALMNWYSGERALNIGSGANQALKDVAAVIAEVVGFTGRIEWDASRPDGTPDRLLDSTRIFRLGWKPRMNFRTGLSEAYTDFLTRYE